MSLVRTPVTSRTGLATVQQAQTERWDVLVGRMARGDQSALATLYDATASTVQGLVIRIVGDRGIADEVTADVYFQAWRHAARYDAGRGAPISWLLAIARSRAIDRLRVGTAWRTGHEPLEEGLGVACDRPGPEDVSAIEQRRGRVRVALARLAPEQRQAVELAYYEGLSHTEIAARTGQPLGTVKTRIRLAMIRLRDTLSDPRSDLQ
jgi:RNA polymerase sigma-70 factor (ECF subfamily)